ncbi:MAG: phage tail protein, partial [Bacteroidia bacterium]|nr:phage tail protein [Bacteroidia bacterium]
MAATPDQYAAEQWPVPKFHFSVQIDGESFSCQEVTGLKLTKEFIEYRFGDDTTFTKRKVPGLKKYENITIKKGVFKNDERVYEWYNTLISDEEGRKDITIQLLDEEHEPVMT